MTTPTKIAFITGGSRGLGRSTALALAARGVDVAFSYHSNGKEADAVVAGIRKFGRKAAALQLDVGEAKSFPAFATQFASVLKETFGSERFDFLVNNAGTSHHVSYMQTTEEQVDALYAIHFKGVFFLTQRLLPLMNDGGRIVNLSSGLARFAMPGAAPYGAMKGAVEVLTRYLAQELGPRGIAVNTVAPGAIATDFSGGLVRDNADVNRMIAQHTALGRVGLPDDIGPMIASLLSEDNRWINAQRIEVSGGMHL